MVSTMMTHKACRRTTATRGGGRSEQDGREGERSGGQVSGRGSQRGGQDVQESDQGSQGSSQGNGANRGGGGVPDFATIIAQQLQNLLPTIVAQGNVRTMNNGRGGCSYKEFIACNSKAYDGKGGAIVYTRWIEKMESVQDISGCRENRKVKYTAGSLIGELCPYNEMQKLETEFWCHAMVRAGHAAYTDRFHKLARLDPLLVTPESKKIKRYIYGIALQIHATVAATKLTTIQSAVQKAGMLTDETIRNGALKKITENRGNSGEPSRDGKARDDNKRSKTGRVFARVINHVKKEYTGAAPKAGPRIVTPVNARNSTTARGACFECRGTDHYKAAYPRLNRAPRPGGNHPNQVMAIEGGQGRENNGNQARGGAFMMGAEEAHQDPNIMTGTFILNNHYATTLFDSGADYSFVFTTFTPLLDLEPSDLGFSYEIEIASGQLVKINKVIRDYKLEIEGHIFDIDLIPFGHGSFDVIVGIDWLSRHKAEIVCHEKVVRIPLPNGEILRVLGEKPEEKMRHLMSVKAEVQKLEYIVIVRNFPEAFIDDLSGLPPS
ncbi:reverse transcriptase domain-containing protein [Tanacetum coccineum]|uniref:Reverse transcriptase domain-containing protein n=1 Tax=Tanacetum coccineum TaxID=301880 RepID=A0ABQ5ER21_9ASTR